jgi:hypothetical protein
MFKTNDFGLESYFPKSSFKKMLCIGIEQMALESLSNSLERIGAINSRGSFLGNFRGSEVTNDLTYDVGKQYFQGDQAISAVDGALYTFTGGIVAAPAPGDPLNPIPVSSLGGPDPYDDPAWLRNAPFAWYYSLAPTVAANAGAWAVTGGAQTGLIGDTDWLITVQGTGTLVGAVAADQAECIFTTNGAAPATVRASVLPSLAAAGVNNWSASLLLTLPADATSITMSGTYAGVFVPQTNLKVTLQRLF